MDSNTDHTITISEDDTHDIGSLSIRISVGQTIHNENEVTVYGWRNDNEELNEDDPFGDCEVEVATVEMSADDLEAYNDNTRHAITITLTQKQVDDALALFDEIYLSDEADA